MGISVESDVWIYSNVRLAYQTGSFPNTVVRFHIICIHVINLDLLPGFIPSDICLFTQLSELLPNGLVNVLQIVTRIWALVSWSRPEANSQANRDAHMGPGQLIPARGEFPGKANLCTISLNFNKSTSRVPISDVNQRAGPRKSYRI
jgi:hypothetical protein